MKYLYENRFKVLTYKQLEYNTQTDTFCLKQTNLHQKALIAVASKKLGYYVGREGKRNDQEIKQWVIIYL
jgi:hypothetical protein